MEEREKKRSVVPFGPQHPVLPEPIHLDLVLEDEKVVDVIPSIGFIHRGLEDLVKKRDFNEYVYVAERTCGICSFGHGLGYVEAVEKCMNVEVPIRAKYLRTIWSEMARIHSHLLWAGLMADAFGFENLFYQCWRLREKNLDLVEMTTGGRLIYSVNKVGGVLKDITPDIMTLAAAGHMQEHRVSPAISVSLDMRRMESLTLSRSYRMTGTTMRDATCVCARSSSPST